MFFARFYKNGKNNIREERAHRPRFSNSIFIPNPRDQDGKIDFIKKKSVDMKFL
jgi:hypothetical protein